MKSFNTINEILEHYSKNSWWDDGEGSLAVKAEYGYDWYTFNSNYGGYIKTGNTNEVINATFHRR